MLNTFNVAIEFFLVVFKNGKKSLVSKNMTDVVEEEYYQENPPKKLLPYSFPKLNDIAIIFQNPREASSRLRIFLISHVCVCIYVFIYLFIYLCHASWPH